MFFMAALWVSVLCLSLVAEAVDITVYRPAASTWKKTQCGGPSGVAEIPTTWAAEVSPASTPLTAYPRPQMVRGSGSLKYLRDNGDASTWANLNGLWEWESTETDEPQFGKALSSSILVPFPVESCLSGVAPRKSADIVQRMWYRLTFDATLAPGRTLLHFGAVDWQATVYLNKARLGNHTGGFDGFSFDVSEHLLAKDNELLVSVFDPSDNGVQPNGKQSIGRIDNPGGDTYTPNSGIWQTVWLERVPTSYISKLKIDQASETTVSVWATLVGGNSFTVDVLDGSRVIARGSGTGAAPARISLPSPQLWSPASPHLYDLNVSMGTDVVGSYFGLRTFVLGQRPNRKGINVTRPVLNGKFTFLAGFLDQSWWPDGQYTAPTDAALESDLTATKMFGLNMIRLHQKVNPERWYYFADVHGLAVLQDMPQKYTGASAKTIPYFVEDLKAMIIGRGNHPCIVQWETFNEADCWSVFKTPPYDVPGITALAKSLDPTRLVDTDSGGGANNLHIMDVNDIHSYPNPGDPKPSATQYAMIGEFGGIGAFVSGKEWVPGKCHTYLKKDTPAEEASTYIEMAMTLKSRADHISASVYTQTTDLELECDGFLNYDRSNKFNTEQTKAIAAANEALIAAASEQVGQSVDVFI
mmetsp:Transcript_86267/g.252342  ORF Transcript_86267/g.252342 Transcript_86267/m.252342 type:complete len:642 (+) Transcript_86267:55-1980(+)